MTKEKWFKVLYEETKKSNAEEDLLTAVIKIGPEAWRFYANNLRKYIDAMDKATEVYNMENKNVTK